MAQIPGLDRERDRALARSVRTGMTRAWLVCALAACGSPHDHPGTDAGRMDGAVDARGDGARIDAFDACPPASAPFIYDAPPAPGTDTARTNAVLQVSAAGPSVITSDFWQNGSLMDAWVDAFSRTAPLTWQRTQVAENGNAFSMGRQLAADAACIAYSNDYDGTLHLQCGLDDRTLAPQVDSSLSIIASGTTQELVYAANGALVEQPFDTDPGTATSIDAGAWTYGPTALALDAAGDLHVAWIAFDQAGTRTIFHAARHAGTWTKQIVDTDTWTDTTDGGPEVAIAITDRVVVAYHSRARRSFVVARRDPAGTFAKATLIAADPGFPSDDVGAGIALATDCMGRVHAIYQRDLSTDGHPNLGLAYGEITDSGLVARSYLSPAGSTAYSYSPAPYSLGFVIGADGHQYVAAEIGGIYGTDVYFAMR